MPKLSKIILVFMLCSLLGIPAFAQNNVEGMRLLTVYSMMRYGTTLYERGDFYEASNVFNHVLSVDSHQTLALKYLKEMGYAPMPGFAPIPVRPVVEKFDPEPVAVDFSNNDSLKKAIEAKNQAIQQLRSQIARLRSQLDH